MPVLNNAKNVLLGTQSLSRIKLGATDIWEWSPEALFLSGQQGVWYEPRPEYLFQDAAGTVPVTADGDPVGLMLDLSGNGHHATQATSAARPIYRTDGVLHWIQFDGVDDTLVAEFQRVQPHWLFAQYIQRVGNFSEFVFDGLGSNEASIVSNSDSQVRAFAGSSLFSQPVPDGDDLTLSVLFDQKSSIIRVNASETSGNAGSDNATGLRVSGIGDGSGRFYLGNIYGVLSTNAIQPSLLDVEKYLASLAGVTL